jgi:tetratricopeptide (TPR) repeat protein
MTAQVQARPGRNDDFETFSGEPAPSSAPAVPAQGTSGRADADRILFEMEELIRETRWKEMLDRFYSLEKKVPVLVSMRRDIVARSKLAFAMSHLKMFDEAIAQLAPCVEKFPDNFMYQGAMAYNAYNSLWAAKNKEIVLTVEARRRMVELACAHFKKAQEIRPDGVTNFYREGMLHYRLEDKPEQGLPLFLRAVSNWEGLSPQEQDDRRQERKNYVKSLYQAASAALNLGSPQNALETVEKCLSEDERSGYLERLFKFFALGKVRFHLGDYEKARDALKFALASRRKNQPADFVHELLARTYLALGHPDRAMESVGQVPENRRRPYVRWTEADILVARNRSDDARKVLLQCADKDRMSRHKALIRLAKLEYQEGFFERAEKCAAAADGFFRPKWGNPCIEACFWRALGALKSGGRDRAEKIAETMEKHFPMSRLLQQLKAALEEKEEKNEDQRTA